MLRSIIACELIVIYSLTNIFMKAIRLNIWLYLEYHKISLI